MKLESDGILINMRPMGERDAIARVFTADYGVICGVMRAALIMKKNRPLVGQWGAMAWNARLDSQLGTFHWDATRNLAAPIMLDRGRLSFMNAAFALIMTLLAEREQYEDLYRKTLALMVALGDGNTDPVAAYLEWEMALLGDLGYALNLTSCSGCGRHDDLCYLSPRTGRAVCATCGAPYAARLYPMPISLGVTGRFIGAICAAQGADMPIARQMINV